MSFPPAGTLRIVVADDSEVVVKPATLRLLPLSYDRQIFRSPFGSTWHQEGDGRRGEQRYEVTAEIHAATLGDAAAPAEALVAYLRNAREILAPFGAVTIAALLDAELRPTHDGFVVRATLGGDDAPRFAQIALVVDDASSMTATELAHQALVEGLGYTVTPISADDVSSTPLRRFGLALFIERPASIETVAYRNAPVPIMGSLGIYGFVSPRFDLTVTTAEPAAGMVGNPILGGIDNEVDVFSPSAASIETGWDGGDPPEMSAGATAYLVRDSGEFVHGAYAFTPQGYRRVGFPIPVDPDDFTEDGETLYSAAIAWAFGLVSTMSISTAATAAQTVPFSFGDSRILIGNTSYLIGSDTVELQEA